jgi:hypothetical protein
VEAGAVTSTIQEQIEALDFVILKWGVPRRSRSQRLKRREEMEREAMVGCLRDTRAGLQGWLAGCEADDLAEGMDLLVRRLHGENV